MINIIVAYNNKRVIGKDNQLLWHIKEDLARFKNLTKYDTVIMGRKTWESLPKLFLVDRHNIVITRDIKKCVEIYEKYAMAPSPTKVEFYNNLEGVIKQTKGDIWIIGGSQIYSQVLDMNIVDNIYATEVDNNLDGDSYFPKINMDKWVVFNKQMHDGFAFTQYVSKYKSSVSPLFTDTYNF